MTRAEMLERAKQIVCNDRNKQYGEPEDNFAVIAELWESYLGVKIGAIDVANMMILFKMARIVTVIHPSLDSYIDIAGYAACAAEMVEVENES